MIGLALLFPSYIYQKLDTRYDRSAFALFSIAIGALFILSYFQVQTWSDDETLFSHVLRNNPRSFSAHNNYGQRIEEKGFVENAIFHYVEAYENGGEEKVALNLLVELKLELLCRR